VPHGSTLLPGGWHTHHGDDFGSAASSRRRENMVQGAIEKSLLSYSVCLTFTKILLLLLG
jgi:hypothetical protein